MRGKADARVNVHANSSAKCNSLSVALSIGKDFSGFAFDEFFHGSN